MLRSMSVVVFALGFAIGFPSCGGDSMTSSEGLSCAGSTAWVRPLSGDGQVRVRALAALRDGSFVAAGHFSGTLRVPGHAGTSLAVTSRGGEDAFVARFAEDGRAVWLAQAGGARDDRAFAVTETSDGAIAVAGAYGEGALFGSRDLTPAATRNSGPTGYVARYDLFGNLTSLAGIDRGLRSEIASLAPLPDGSVLALGTVTTLRRDFLPDVAMRPGAVRVAATREGTSRAVHLDKPAYTYGTMRERLGTPFVSPPVPAASEEVALSATLPLPAAASLAEARLFGSGGTFRGGVHRLRTELVLARVAKEASFLWTRVLSASGATRVAQRVGPDGKVVWVTTVGAEGDVRGAAIAALDDGTFAVAGELRGGMNVGEGEHAQRLVARGELDTFVLRVDGDGRVLAARQEGEASRWTFARGVAPMPGGDYALASEVVLPPSANEARATFVVTRVHPDGKAAWQRTVAAAPMLRVAALGATPQGNLVAVGTHERWVDATIGSSPTTFGSPGGTDAFVVMLGADGRITAGRLFAGSADEHGDAVLARADGSTLVAARTSGTLVVGFGEPGALKLEAEGAGDAFLTLLR
jgi:hypothetical protein